MSSKKNAFQFDVQDVLFNTVYVAWAYADKMSRNNGNSDKFLAIANQLAGIVKFLQAFDQQTYQKFSDDLSMLTGVANMRYHNG